ncbi:MAG: hypothetical protein KDK70_03670 [Myxococcales bacterium]|nr:hypothetical protein [Myxococcales bacterium]
MLDERGAISPFGWMITCEGRTPSQVRDDVRLLAQQSAQAWARHFPAEHGYRVELELPEHASSARLFVHRGDFQAEVSVEHDPQAGAGSAAVRMYGRARSDTLTQAHVLGDRVVARARVIGWGGGVAVFLSLAWLMIGVRDPIYVLGGMLLVVALLLTVMAGGTLGTWFGERLAELHRGRARQRVHADEGLRDDIRRWRAVSRQLGAQRALLLGHRRQPFRSEPRPRSI